MTIYNLISNSEVETLNIAKKLASLLNKKDVVVLLGDLGSGKTKFTEGFLSFFNLENEISSPTFNIVNEYKKNDITIYHFDVYRLEDSSEFYEIGGDEYFENGICLIEWGNIILDTLPKEYLEIKFKKDDSNENIRYIQITAHGERFKKLLSLNF